MELVWMGPLGGRKKLRRCDRNRGLVTGDKMPVGSQMQLHWCHLSHLKFQIFNTVGVFK